jgi:hypothetical protein
MSKNLSNYTRTVTLQGVRVNELRNDGVMTEGREGERMRVRKSWEFWVEGYERGPGPGNIGLGVGEGFLVPGL